MKVIQIDETYTHLDAIKNLWRINSRTLGFFPEGAFNDHAAKRCILVAESSTQELLGYLLYRIVKRGKVWPQATIVHLCIQSTHRNRGTAKALIAKLHEITKNRCERIDLRCRRDFDVTDFWRKNGFVYHSEDIGKAGHPVIHWVLTIRQPPLMTLLDQEKSQNKLRAVIDANVLYRLQDPIPLSPDHEIALSEEAKSLLEEWLVEDILLLVTDESLNEIEQNDNPSERARRIEYARRYQSASCHFMDVQPIVKNLQHLFPNNPNQNTEADIRQIAQAIVSNADCFITQDNALLRKADDINSEFHIKIMSPGQFIGHVDEVIRETKYRPEHLAGAYSLTNMLLKSPELSSIYEVFRSNETQEKRLPFESTLRNYMAQPDKYEIQLCKNNENKPISLLIYDRSETNELSVPFLRVARTPLHSTIYRYLLCRAIDVSMIEKRSICKISKTNMNYDLEEALRELCFIESESDWIKISLSYLGTSSNLIPNLTQLKAEIPYLDGIIDDFLSAISTAINLNDTVELAEIERRLWPAKILDAGNFNYIIPIKPNWAQHLFDSGLAEQTLWGAKEELALRLENVYYRSCRPSKIAVPSRILWYVTEDRGYVGSKSIRACSILDEVTIGPACDLYSRFRRLGIYQWHDVLKTAKNNSENHIMALRFSNTELFPKPVKLETMREIFKQSEGHDPVLQSPMFISERCFADIYSAAKELSGGVL
ncbi:MAG: hypothetical protein A4E74_01522 [Syntrophus sp. PtaB.Bin075]|nr:MAG: hypothetical protein A4E74_01522 [Syntrophus sp. PtaB.Bin075]